VGKNLQDHITSFVGPFAINQSASFNLDRDLTPQAFYNFANHGMGPLTSTGVQASAFLVSDEAKKAGEGDWPDFQYMLLGTSIYNNAPNDFEFAFNVRSGVLRKYYETIRNKDSFMIITALARPKGRGEILLAGTDPTLPPLMDPNYLKEETDVRVMIEG
jgi:choline dehydrogenase